MQKHTLYRFTSFLLLPAAALLTAMDLLFLFSALANPPLLLPVFVLACIGIYVFTSFAFLNKGILQGRPCRPSLKDWIKANAIVALVGSILMLLNTCIAIARPALVIRVVDQMLAMQPSSPPFSKEQFIRTVTVMLYVLGTFAALLIVHIIITFRLLRLYRHVFVASADDPQ